MVEKRDFESGRRYLFALIIGSVAFIFVFAISYSVSYLEIQRVSNQQFGVGYDIFSDKLNYSFFNSSICAEGALTKLSQDLGFQGNIIDELEKRLGKKNSDVLLRKKFYSLIEIEHFQFVQEFNSQCGEKVNTILFFYSNNASLASKSDEAGKILNIVAGQTENLTIYSFDVDLDSTLVRQLGEKYNVTASEAPVIVIDEKTKLRMPANVLNIESHFY